jgi:hypothetical protein
MGVQRIHADRQTDMAKLIGTFRDYANTLKIGLHHLQIIKPQLSEICSYIILTPLVRHIPRNTSKGGSSKGTCFLTLRVSASISVTWVLHKKTKYGKTQK